MSSFKKVLIGAAVAVAVTTIAVAQSLIGDGDPWDMKEGMAYVVHPTGKMRTLPIGEHGMTTLSKRAKPVPRGTVFFTRDGQLYMMQRGGFDRTGKWMHGT